MLCVGTRVKATPEETEMKAGLEPAPTSLHRAELYKPVTPKSVIISKIFCFGGLVRNILLLKILLLRSLIDPKKRGLEQNHSA